MKRRKAKSEDDSGQNLPKPKTGDERSKILFRTEGGRGVSSKVAERTVSEDEGKK